jgi:uncharacterized protein involved in exopolysaccharide biosynthesis
MSDNTDTISLSDLWRSIRDHRVLVAGVALVVAVCFSVYAAFAPLWYRAEVLLSPVDRQAPHDLMGQFGGLASLAGISIDQGGTGEAVAVLKSRHLAQQFIEDFELLPVLFAHQWDKSKQGWKGSDPRDWPDVRDGVHYFDEHIRGVTENPKTGLVTLSIEWRDPDEAARWANELVSRVNLQMRERSLREARANIEYLRGQLADTNILALQQSIGRLLESELQKLMLAEGNMEFSFRTIDPAVAPKLHQRPKRALLIGLGLFLGLFLGAVAAFAKSGSNGTEVAQGSMSKRGSS